MDTEIAIAINNLTKYYGKDRGVIDLTFRVENGEVFGFLGPNGAGKTTTIRLLLDLIRPTSGSGQIYGQDIREKSTDIKKIVGYSPGDLVLYENMTGENFLRFFSNLRRGVDQNYVQELAERLTLNLKRKISSLSHGNKQKIALVQAFMHKPKLIVLDEPTNGLDPLVQQEFYRLVEEAKSNQQTIFISSHNLHEVERVCDRIGIIRGGRLIAVEKIANLKSKIPQQFDIFFAKPVEKNAFKSIPGVEDVVIENRRLSCKVKGNIDSFIKQVAKYEVVTIVSKEQNLEDIFLTYYK